MRERLNANTGKTVSSVAPTGMVEPKKRFSLSDAEPLRRMAAEEKRRSRLAPRRELSTRVDIGPAPKVQRGNPKKKRTAKGSLAARTTVRSGPAVSGGTIMAAVTRRLRNTLKGGPSKARKTTPDARRTLKMVPEAGRPRKPSVQLRTGRRTVKDLNTVILDGPDGRAPAPSKMSKALKAGLLGTAAFGAHRLHKSRKAKASKKLLRKRLGIAAAITAGLTGAGIAANSRNQTP